MAGYLWGLMGRVLTDLAWPAWTRPLVVAGGAAFVLGATFVIVKTRSWPKPEGPHVP